MTDTTDKALMQLDEDGVRALVLRLADAHRLTMRREGRGDVTETWIGTCSCGGVFRSPHAVGISFEHLHHLDGIARRLAETNGVDLGVAGKVTGIADVLRIRLAQTVQNGSEGLPPEKCILIDRSEMGQGYRVKADGPAQMALNRLRAEHARLKALADRHARQYPKDAIGLQVRQAKAKGVGIAISAVAPFAKQEREEP
jgi:hypothetical protein